MDRDAASAQDERQPYVKPQVVQVQRRIDGDNLAQSCKIGGQNASFTKTCAGPGCSQNGS